MQILCDAPIGRGGTWNREGVIVFVSMTSLYAATNLNERDSHRSVDAAKIPYVVLPPARLKHAKLGDFATVVNLNNGKNDL